jgi:hypothetical protein
MTTKLPIATSQDVGGVKQGADVTVGSDGTLATAYRDKLGFQSQTTQAGEGASASGSRSVAVGYQSRAQATDAVALGANSIADADSTVSVGSATLQRRITHLADGVDDQDAATVGQLKKTGGGQAQDPRIRLDGPGSATATLKGGDGTAIALGGNAKAVGWDGPIAIGGQASAVDYSVALGTGANAKSDSSLAFGANAQASSDNNIAIGAAANSAGATASVAIGRQATTNGSSTVALGNASVSQGESSVSLGSAALAAGSFSVAIGATSSTRAGVDDNTVSFGSDSKKRRLINVADGTADTDAVNFRQMQNYVQGNGSGGSGSEFIKIVGTGAAAASMKQPGMGAIAIGPVASCDGYGLAIGINASVSGVGPNIAMGTYASASAGACVAVGAMSNATQYYDVALGASAQCPPIPGLEGNASRVALGDSPRAEGVRSIAVGASANTKGEGAVAIGAASSASGAQSVALGSGAQASEDNVVSIGRSDALRRLVNLATGVADTDAVNVAQLKRAGPANGFGQTAGDAIEHRSQIGPHKFYVDEQLCGVIDKPGASPGAQSFVTYGEMEKRLQTWSAQLATQEERLLGHIRELRDLCARLESATDSQSKALSSEVKELRDAHERTARRVGELTKR